MPEWLRASAPGTYAGCVRAASKRSVARWSVVWDHYSHWQHSAFAGDAVTRSQPGGPESAPSNPICADQAIQSRLVRNSDSIPTRDQ